MLAEVLAEHGFRTAAFIGAAPLDPAVQFDQGFDFYGARYTLERTGQDYPQPLERRAKEVTEAVLAWLDRERPEERLTLPKRMVTPGKKDSARISREHNHLKEVFAGRSPRFWTSFEKPVDDAVNSVFGKRRVLNGKPKSPHSGTDFRSPSGTPVRPISNGRVALVSDLFYTGNTVVVDHGEGLFSLYAHLSEVLVEEGHDLLVTDILGKVGSTGRSTGAHLHLTVKLFGERIDPLALLAAFKD